MRAVDILCLA